MSTESPPRLFSDLQRKLVGFALSFGAVVAIVGLSVVSLTGLGRLTAYFSGVLWPLAVAGILALILRPAVDLIERRLRLRRLAAVGLLFGLFLLAIVGLLLLVVPPLVAQVLDFVSSLPNYWANAKSYVQLHYPAWIDFSQRQLAHPTVRRVIDSLTAEGRTLLAQTIPSLKIAGGGVLAVFGFLTHLAIVPIYLFFLLLTRGEPTARLAEHLPFLSVETRDDVVFLVREFIAIVVSFFRGQLLIGLIMGVLLALGFTLVGLKFALFLGLAIGVLNIVPYLGTIIGLAVTLPLAFFQPGGGWQLVGLVLLVKIVVQNIEGWILTPQIMGHRTGLHPVAIIVAIFFWSTALDGLLGLVLAIPLTAFIVTAWRLARRKYFGAGAPGEKSEIRSSKSETNSKA